MSFFSKVLSQYRFTRQGISLKEKYLLALLVAFALVGMIPLYFFPYDKAREQELSLYSRSRRGGEAAEALPQGEGG